MFAVDDAMKLIVENDGNLIIPANLVAKAGLSHGNQADVSISDGKILISKVDLSLPPRGTNDINAVTGAAIKRKNLQTGVQYVKGIGPKLAGLLEKREIRTVEDVLYLLPLRYEDRRELTPIARLRPGQTAVFCGNA